MYLSMYTCQIRIHFVLTFLDGTIGVLYPKEKMTLKNPKFNQICKKIAKFRHFSGLNPQNVYPVYGQWRR